MTATLLTTAPADVLEAIRAQRPLVHQITNYVVMNATANATLAMGGLPVMAHAAEEVEEMTAVAGALVLNIGTLSPEWVESMILAGKAANARNIPVVLDPVGAGATSYRTATAFRILDEVRITVLRGNAAEIATLAGQEAVISGVESLASAPGSIVASEAATKLNMTVAVSGAVDHVSDGARTIAVTNGHPLLAQITGSGCIATAITGCALAVTPGDGVDAAVAAYVLLGIAGELAAVGAGGPGTFHVRLYDALAGLTVEDVTGRTATRVL